MIKRESKITIRELVFYAFFAVMFGMRMWGMYESKPLYGPLLLLGFGLWGLSILMTEHTVAEYAVIIAFMGLAGLVYINTGEKGLLLYFALMLGMKGISVKGLFKAGLVAGMAGMITLTFLSAFGIIEDVAYLQSRPLVGEVFRRSLGFPHPNTLSSSFTIMVIMIMYLVGHGDKIRIWKTSVVLMVIAVYLYIYSGSNTGIIITFGFLVLNLFYAYRGKVGIIERIVLILLFPFLWIVSIVGPALANEDIIARVRSISYNYGSRWAVGNYYWVNNHLSLFGSRLVNPDSNPYGIDLSQLYLLLQLGIVAFVVITLLWMCLLHYEVKNQRISELVITFSLLVMGVSDPFLYNIGFKNLAFCFMGVWLYKAVEQLPCKLPDFASKKIHILKFGSNKFSFPVIDSKGIKVAATARRGIVTYTSIALVCVIAIGYYFMIPNPNYAITDRNYGEQKTGKGYMTDGRTYTRDEIKSIKDSGNIVLNYTDENEVMYTYYSHEDSSVSDGYYAPNAAVMEKFRLSLSVVFWGFILIAFIAKVLKMQVFSG